MIKKMFERLTLIEKVMYGFMILSVVLMIVGIFLNSKIGFNLMVSSLVLGLSSALLLFLELKKNQKKFKEKTEKFNILLQNVVANNNEETPILNLFGQEFEQNNSHYSDLRSILIDRNTNGSLIEYVNITNPFSDKLTRSLSQLTAERTNEDKYFVEVANNYLEHKEKKGFFNINEFTIIAFILVILLALFMIILI